jgi:hypothetical protein
MVYRSTEDEEGLADGITFGKYCVPLYQIVEARKINESKVNNEVMNFAVAVLAEVAERAK